MSEPSHRIRLDMIPEDGLEVSADLDAVWAVDAARDSLEGDPERLHFDMQVSLVGGYVRVQGRGSALTPRVCDRCQEPVTLEVKGNMDLYYSPLPKDTGGESVLLGKDDLDIGFFEGDAIDLTDVVSEQLALWAPSRVRCGDAGVQQVGAPHPCTLPGLIEEEPDVHPSSPFAGLRLPK